MQSKWEPVDPSFHICTPLSHSDTLLSKTPYQLQFSPTLEQLYDLEKEKTERKRKRKKEKEKERDLRGKKVKAK